MNWKFSSDKPIYAQLIDQIEWGIISGQLGLGERLNSVRELATEAGVNPNTMQKALAELERRGMVYTNRTSGRYITEDEELVGTLRSELAVQAIGELLSKLTALGYNRQELLKLLEEKLEENVQ